MFANPSGRHDRSPWAPLPFALSTIAVRPEPVEG